LLQSKSLLLIFLLTLGAVLFAPKCYAETNDVSLDFNDPIDTWPGGNDIAEQIFAKGDELLDGGTIIKLVTVYESTSDTLYGYTMLKVDVPVSDLKFYVNSYGIFCISPNGFNEWRFARGYYRVYKASSGGEPILDLPSRSSELSSPRRVSVDGVYYYQIPQTNIRGDNTRYINFKGRTLKSSNFESTPYQPVEPLLFNDNSTVDNNSDLGLLSDLYNISFTVTFCDKEEFVGKTYPVILKEIQSDNGYNMISLQVPALTPLSDPRVYKDTALTCFGYYHFSPSYGTKKLDNMTLSFCSDFKPIIDSPDLQAPSNYPYLLIDDRPVLSKVSMTVNHLSFIYSNNSLSFNNRELTAIDYRNGGRVLPDFKFYSNGTINRDICGSFIYNFTYSSIYDEDLERDLDKEEVDKMAKDGSDKNNDTRDKVAYVPKILNNPNLNVIYGYDPSFDYDFSGVSPLLGGLFHNYVTTVVVMSIMIGILGYVLFGKE